MNHIQPVRYYALSIVLILGSIFVRSAYAYGPFDYTNPQHFTNKLPVVEQYHFNNDIEYLRKSIDGNTIASHLWYTLRAFPNHHRALNSMARLWRIRQSIGRVPKGIKPQLTPTYLFTRAIEFAPDDGVVKLLYGIHLFKIGNKKSALHYLAEASKQSDSTELHYNLGIVYYDMKIYDKSLHHAKIAYSKNYPLPGLRQKLIKIGRWK